MNNNTLFGFTVFDDETGRPITDRVFAVTNTGELLIERSNGSYVEIPKQGKFRVCYGNGALERW